jgi:hypothetical protein
VTGLAPTAVCPIVIQPAVPEPWPDHRPVIAWVDGTDIGTTTM